jgi:TonB family protein
MAMKTVNFLLALMVACAVPAFAQDELQRAKDLYAAAAYEEALAVLTAVPSAGRNPQIGQYRVFCLIALGQGDAAQQAIEDLLEADPLYQPDPMDTPPRVLEAFADARARALPGIAKQMYVDSKTALERKDREAAITGFQGVLRTIDSAPDMAAEFADLRVLADGFLTLSRALPEPAPKPAPAEEVAAAPTGADASTPPVAVSTRPVAVKQELPPWIAYDGLRRLQTYSGLLRVRVSADGRVQSAQIVQSVHPAYDRLLLRAAESWVYEPATENGIPVPTDIVVQIQLRPPGE